MESPRTGCHFKPQAKTATTNRKIVQGIRKNVGLALVDSPPIYTDAVGMDGRGNIDNGCAPSVEPGVAIPLFKSYRDLSSAPALDEAFASVTDQQLKALILKEGIITIFSGFLAVAFCIVTIAIPFAELPWVNFHGEHMQAHGGSYWAIRLYGLLATCLCMLGFAWLGECKRSRECNCCHDEVEMSISRAQEAEQKAHHAHRAKQQFMTYVFHNVRGNFLSNAVKFSAAGGKLELSIKCEEVLQSDESFPCKSGVLCNAASNRTRDCSLCPCLGEGLNKHPKDPPKPPPICTCCGQGSSAKVLITVKDMSNGISGEDQAKLFEPYSFVSSGWVQKAGVSGLGLSMAKRFVEQSGGYIGVDSKEREGSMFYFCLPYPLIPISHGVEYKLPSNDEWLDGFMMEDSEWSRAPSVSGKRERTLVQEEKAVCITLPVDKGRRKVLLVEDTEINRVILRKVLQNLDLSCEEAENGKVAVDFLKQGRTYDLILMDKEMPVMDGHEATRQLRLMGVKTPIVALTGNALQSDKELFFEAGVDDFQTKPLSRDKLVQVLARFGLEIPCG